MSDSLALRFRRAMLEAGLRKEGAAVEPSASPLDDDTTTEQPETLEEQIGHLRSDEAPDKPISAGNLFQNHEAHPYVLGLAMLSKYGPDWMEWEPGIVVARILNDFKTRSVSDLTMDKLQALKTLHFSDAYWTRWEVFLTCTMPLVNLHPDFEVMQVPTVVQCAVSVHIAERIRNDVPWSDEIKAYLATVHKFEGILFPVPPLDFVPVDTDGLPVDSSEVLQRWPSVRDSGKAPTKETVEDEQLRRMLLVQLELDESDKRLKTQLRMVFHG